MRCNVFVYGFGATLAWWPHLELRLLRALGKRILFFYHGSDSRPPYLDGQIMASDRGVTIERGAALFEER